MNKDYILLWLLCMFTFSCVQDVDTIVEGNIDSMIENDAIICIVESTPQFPGGYDSLQSFIRSNLKWNQGRSTISGRSFIQFVVENDGSITNVEVIKGLCESCDKAAIDVIKLLPPFIPATLPNGHALRTRMIVPVLFEI